MTEEDSRKFLNLPSSPGVYLMRNSAGKIIYIGKARSLRHRVASYFQRTDEPKTFALLHSLRHIDYILAVSEREALILERQLIGRYQPYFNVMFRDDKSYPYLKLTMKEDFPRLFMTRKLIKDGSEYFGPFPQMSQFHKFIRWLQRTFKWRSCEHEFDAAHLPPRERVKSCLYLQTGRCPGPCLGRITPQEYKKNLQALRLFLKGRYRNLLELWEQEMQEASRDLNYEKAAEVRDRIRNVKKMDERITVRELQPAELETSLRTSQSLQELKEKLNLKKWPIIIEGFDISNTSGTEPVGSMVRFHSGKPDKDNYRKFKIRTVTGIDDTAMLKETVFRRYRRLKEEHREMPDLILIDGGKGQLSHALESLVRLELAIPAVSLAKREEEIFLPGHSEPLRLPRNSPALQLLQAIRDEAHRFAVTFHRERRKNAMGIPLRKKLY